MTERTDRTARITVRLTPGEREQIARAARAVGLDASTAIRLAALTWAREQQGKSAPAVNLPKGSGNGRSG